MKERNEEPGPKEEKQKYHTNNLKKKKGVISHMWVILSTGYNV